jgi:hypothetical protein
MQRARTCGAGVGLLIIGLLISGAGHAAGQPAAVFSGASGQSAVGLVWQELHAGGEKNFDPLIPRDSRPAANPPASASTPAAPSLLWMLGASIIGLATVARRRSH